MRIRLLSITLLLCMLLGSCATAIVNTSTPSTGDVTSVTDTTITEPTVVEPQPTKIEDIGLYPKGQFSKYGISRKRYAVFCFCVYKSSACQ